MKTSLAVVNNLLAFYLLEKETLTGWFCAYSLWQLTYTGPCMHVFSFISTDQTALYSSRRIDKTFSYALNDGLSLILIYRNISKQCKPRSDCDSRDKNFCKKK